MGRLRECVRMIANGRSHGALLVLALLTTTFATLLGILPASAEAKSCPSSGPIPCAVFNPPAGAPGMRVRFRAEIDSHFVAQWRRTLKQRPLLRGIEGVTSRCPAVGSLLQFSARMTHEGALEGRFVVPSVATCSRPSAATNVGRTVPLTPGTYNVFIGSFGSVIGALQVSAPPSTLAFTGRPIGAEFAIGAAASLLGLLLIGLASAGESASARQVVSARPLRDV